MKKRILSLILVIGILVGSIMCFDTSAASTASKTEVELIQATVIPDEWGEGFSGFVSGKTLVPVFSGGPIGNSPGNYALAVFIVGKESNWTLGNATGAPLVFRMNLGWDSNATLGSNYYATLKTDASGKQTIAQLPKTSAGHSRGLSDTQLAKYTSDVDTFAEIVMLAEDLNARVEFRIWEKTDSSYTLNNYVQSIWESESGNKTYLKAKSGLKVDEYGGYQTSATRDSAGCPLVFTDSAFQMTDAMYIEEDDILRISFNKVVQYGGRGNYCVNGRMAVVNEKGVIAKDSANAALSYSLPLETVCPWSAPSTVYNYTMKAADIAAYNELKAEAAALNAKNDGHTYKLVYELEEINSQVLTTRGEASYNHFVDSIWADGYYPLMANACSKADGVPDTAMQEIDSVAVDPQIKPSQCAKILSVTAEDIYSYELTVTFDRPMNVDNVSLSLTYKADPATTDEGYWQSGFYAYEYVTSGEGVEYKEVGGEKFSNKVVYKFNQPMDHYYIPEGAGIRFMEYNNCEGIEKNNGIINPDYAHDEYGRGLAANVTGAGGYDLAWQTVSMESYSDILLAATKVADGKVALSFLYPVKVADASKITVNGTAVTSAASDNGEEYCTSWILAGNTEGSVSIAAGALECAYQGTAVPALSATVNNFAGNGTDFSSEFTEGEEYSFMNTDTGREITLGTETDFELVKANGVNLWYLKNDEGKYLDLTGISAKATDTPVAYLLVKGENSRYQLVKDNGAVMDSDKNSGTEASLAMARVSDKLISSGWYITKKGDTKPLKVLPIGDSNVYGTNPDLPAGQPQTGYRVELSQKLTQYFGRVVFVGNRKNETTTIDSTGLNRHSGYPGYVVEDEWNLGGIGIQPLTDAIMTKYTPDIVIMSIGGNDCAYIAGNPPTDSNMNMILTNYENYIKQVEAYLGDNGIILCNTMIPNVQANSVDITKQLFTEEITKLIQQLSDEGYDMALGDNRSVLLEGIENGEDIMSSDEVHLSVNGSSVLANNWYKIITSAYGSDSIKKDYKVTFEGEGYTVTSSDNAEAIEPGNSYSFKIALKDGYGGAPVVKANGEVLTAENGVYSFKNMLGDKTVSVSGITQKEYEIKVIAGEGGSADKATSNITHGEDFEVIFTPDTGYAIADVKVDGSSVGAVSKYEFTNVDASHTVEVTFEKVEAPKEDKDENKDEDNKTENKEEPKDKAPATGDINVVLLVSLAVLSLGAVIVAIRKKNKV